MSKGTVTLLLFAAVLVSVGASGMFAQVGYLNRDLLVEPEWLKEHLDLEHVRVVDFGRDRSEYDSGHVPGAVYASVEMVTTRIGGVPMMLAHPERIAGLLVGVGIDARTTVVIYDDAGGLWGSRLLWTMEYLGHPDVRLLDGGWQGWLDAGGEVSTEPHTHARGSFEPRVEYTLLATRDWIMGRLDDDRVVLLDVRTPEEYSGEDVRAERGGRIPGAVNIDWTRALADDGSELVLPAEELKSLFERSGVTPDKEIVTYCQAGIRAAHTYFVLRLLGYPRVRVYDASWAEWGNDLEAPVE